MVLHFKFYHLVIICVALDTMSFVKLLYYAEKCFTLGLSFCRRIFFPLHFVLDFEIKHNDLQTLCGGALGFPSF